jgi:hypothetical protein
MAGLRQRDERELIVLIGIAPSRAEGQVNVGIIALVVEAADASAYELEWNGAAALLASLAHWDSALLRRALIEPADQPSDAVARDLLQHAATLFEV